MTCKQHMLLLEPSSALLLLSAAVQSRQVQDCMAHAGELFWPHAAHSVQHNKTEPAPQHGKDDK